MYIIVGLGNPGKRYEWTRHNAGFLTLDILSGKWDIPLKKVGFHSLYGEGMLGTEKLVLVKPQLFMNRSGESVLSIVDFYKTPLTSLIVIYDDVDLPLGRIRIRKCGSAGSHNGMKSVIYQLQSEDFIRVRIGVDKPPPEWDLADYVLSGFHKDELNAIEEALKSAANAVETIVASGAGEAQKSFNGTSET
ncbi:MAG: aminoacyl-tRNA hydrolase [Bacillota bacterium]|nr:aminoacyl-tRNA hydrolase [Bacillota bacterium]